MLLGLLGLLEGLVSWFCWKEAWSTCSDTLDAQERSADFPVIKFVRLLIALSDNSGIHRLMIGISGCFLDYQ